MLLVDASLLPLLEKVRAQLTTVEHVVVMGDGPRAGGGRGCSTTKRCWPTRPSGSHWPELDEETPPRSATPRAPPAIPRECSTPTARWCCTRWPFRSPMRFGSRERDVVLSIVPMFHANAWGLPFAAGDARLQAGHAGAPSDPKDLADLIDSEARHLRRRRADHRRRAVSVPQAGEAASSRPCGRSSSAARRCPGCCSRASSATSASRWSHAWGMTELSPAGIGLPAPVRHVGVARGGDAPGSACCRAARFPLVELRVVDRGRPGGALGRRHRGRAAGAGTLGGPAVLRRGRLQRAVRRRLVPHRGRRLHRRARARSVWSTGPRTW